MKHSVLYFATKNHTKFITAQRTLCAMIPHLELKQLALDLPELQISDQALISEQKARAAWQQVQAPVLADDGGIYFDAYQGFPGFMTKFVWKSLGVAGILKLLAHNNRVTRKLFLTYCDGPDSVHSFVGQVSGSLIAPPLPLPDQCDCPFEYLVVPDGYDTVYQSLSPEHQTIDSSFRLNGLHKFAQWYIATHPSE